MSLSDRPTLRRRSPSARAARRRALKLLLSNSAMLTDQPDHPDARVIVAGARYAAFWLKLNDLYSRRSGLREAGRERAVTDLATECRHAVTMGSIPRAMTQVGHLTRACLLVCDDDEVLRGLRANAPPDERLLAWLLLDLIDRPKASLPGHRQSG